MNKVILIVFLGLILTSIGYAWHVYINEKDYDVSIIIEEQTYFSKNSDIEDCIEDETCLVVE